MEIPRRGKFYQDPGLRHTSDIFHVLTTQSFIIRFSPHTGGGGYAWRLQKQTDKRSRVQRRFVGGSFNVFSYSSSFSSFQEGRYVTFSCDSRWTESANSML